MNTVYCTTAVRKLLTAYNDFFKNDKIINATEQELVELKAHF